MEVLYALIAGGVGGALVAGVISLIVLRSVPRDSDVDALIEAVEAQQTESRRARMRAVRAGSKEADASPPPELREPPAPAPGGVKAELRKRVFGTMRGPGGTA